MGDYFACYLAKSGSSMELLVGQDAIVNVGWKGQVSILSFRRSGGQRALGNMH